MEEGSLSNWCDAEIVCLFCDIHRCGTKVIVTQLDEHNPGGRGLYMPSVDMFELCIN